MAAKSRGVHGERDWVAVRIEVDEAVSDAVTNFLIEQGATGVLTEDLVRASGHRRVLLEAHVRRPQEPALVGAVREYVLALETMDPAWTAGPLEVLPLPEVDWESVFRAHHTPVAVGARLLVAPPWNVPDAPGREILIIEPGMAFGTGQHATTRTCLEEIEVLVSTGRVGSGLDVGTGTGILAAAMARLGVPRVVALDVDTTVMPLARAMLDSNRASHVGLLAGSVAAVHGTFDLVVANILADTLVAEAPHLLPRVATGGSLVLSGILEDQVARVVGAMAGWIVVATRADGPWRTVRLMRGRTA